MKEIWKNIDGFEGKYLVSNLGRIKSIKRNLIKIQKITWAYKSINLWKDAKCTCFRVHRLIAIAFIPNPKNKPQVNHKDGDKLNNNSKNLEWMTSSENTKHSFDNNLQQKGNGELNSMSKITESEVLQIRKLYNEGQKLVPISKQFDISFQAISKIVNKQRWKHI